MKVIKSTKLPDKYQDFFITSLQEKGKVRLIGIGTFELREIGSRQLYNNFSGKIIQIKKHKRVGFKPSLKLKKLI